GRERRAAERPGERERDARDELEDPARARDIDPGREKHTRNRADDRAELELPHRLGEAARDATRRARAIEHRCKDRKMPARSRFGLEEVKQIRVPGTLGPVRE